MRFTIFIYGLIQLLPLYCTHPLPSISAQENILEFYENELDIIAENFCENAKNLSEKLLQDKDIKEASLPETKEFKIYLQDFLQDFPHFKRFKIYQPLLTIFMNTAISHENRKYEETELKFKQVLKQYLANIFKEYEQNYKKFVNERFVPKIEEFKKQLSPQDIKQMPELNEYLDKLKTCQDIQCFPTNSDNLLNAINATRDVIIKYSKMDAKRFLTLLHISLNKMGKLILKDEKLSQLSLATKQNLTNDINEYCTKFESSNDIEQFGTLVKEELKFPNEYHNNKEIMPLKDGVLFKEIIDKYKSNTNKSKFELENNNVMFSFSLKMLFVAFLAPKEYNLTISFGTA